MRWRSKRYPAGGHPHGPEEVGERVLRTLGPGTDPFGQVLTGRREELITRSTLSGCQGTRGTSRRIRVWERFGPTETHVTGVPDPSSIAST